MSNKKSTLVTLVFASLTALSVVSVGFCFNRDNCIAVAYTEENFQGISWEIYITGEYDLWWKIDREVENPRLNFDLPNDSIASIRVRPGYRVTLFEHAELGGDTLVLDADMPSLGSKWTKQASSLAIYRIEDQELVGKWQVSVRSDSTKFTEGKEMDRDEIIAVMEKHRDGFSELMEAGEQQWYGTTTDEQRIALAEYMLELFEALGYDVSFWTPNTFAQSLNNFYDWTKDLSLWDSACLILNVDEEAYEEIFSSIE